MQIKRKNSGTKYWEKKIYGIYFLRNNKYMNIYVHNDRIEFDCSSKKCICNGISY